MQSRRLLSLLPRARLIRVLEKMLDESEFLSPHGIRAISKYHQQHPFVLPFDHHDYRVDYEPAESSTAVFGGNSNWRGPVWFPVNYLLIESLQRFSHYHGDDFKVEFPTGSGQHVNLKEVAAGLSCRLSRIFLRNQETGRGRFGAERRNSRAIRIFVTMSGSTNISTGTTARGSGRAIRLVGRRWSPSFCSKAGSRAVDVAATLQRTGPVMVHHSQVRLRPDADAESTLRCQQSSGRVAAAQDQHHVALR